MWTLSGNEAPSASIHFFEICEISIVANFMCRRQIYSKDAGFFPVFIWGGLVQDYASIAPGYRCNHTTAHKICQFVLLLEP